MRPVSQAIRKRSRGSAVVEFALGFPLLFLIFAGTFQFGYSFYIFNRLETAVRGAARYAALATYAGTNGTPSSAYVTAVQNYAVTGDPAGTAPALVPGLTTSHISVSVASVNGVPNRVQVGVNGYPINAIFRTFTLSGRPFASFRYSGRISAL